jgi:hypothetical protein
MKKLRIIGELKMELKTASGDKVAFGGLSKNKGVVWIELDTGWKTHILINDLDAESQEKVNKLLEEAKNEKT